MKVRLYIVIKTVCLIIQILNIQRKNHFQIFYMNRPVIKGKHIFIIQAENMLDFYGVRDVYIFKQIKNLRIVWLQKKKNFALLIESF